MWVNSLAFIWSVIVVSSHVRVQRALSWIAITTNVTHMQFGCNMRAYHIFSWHQYDIYFILGSRRLLNYFIIAPNTFFQYLYFDILVCLYGWCFYHLMYCVLLSYVFVNVFTQETI